jgi:hypothetical protein
VQRAFEMSGCERRRAPHVHHERLPLRDELLQLGRLHPRHLVRVEDTLRLLRGQPLGGCHHPETHDDRPDESTMSEHVGSPSGSLSVQDSGQARIGANAKVLRGVLQ